MRDNATHVLTSPQGERFYVCQVHDLGPSRTNPDFDWYTCVDTDDDKQLWFTLADCDLERL